MADQKPKSKKVPALRVRASVEGFRRAGRAWSVEAVDVPVADFTKAQVEALRGEPRLVVVDAEIDVAIAAE